MTINRIAEVSTLALRSAVGHRGIAVAVDANGEWTKLIPSIEHGRLQLVDEAVRPSSQRGHVADGHAMRVADEDVVIRMACRRSSMQHPYGNQRCCDSLPRRQSRRLERPGNSPGHQLSIGSRPIHRRYGAGTAAGSPGAKEAIRMRHMIMVRANAQSESEPTPMPSGTLMAAMAA